MKYIFISVFTLAAFLILSLPVKSLAIATPSFNAVATIATSNCTNSQGCAQQGAETLDAGSTLSISKIIGTVISILAWIIGIVSVFMVIFGGFRFVTSGGDSNAVSSARSTIFYALIGLVVAVLAQVLIHYVLYKFFPKL
jgi:small-conductance mechanosensitive channel